MFKNLIESSSHSREFKRRGTFLLFTTATYLVLFAITGVASIYAYHAHLEQPNLDVVAIISPKELEVDQLPPNIISDPICRCSGGNSKNNTFDVRRTPTARVDQPEVAPATVSTEQNPPLPIRTNKFVIGDQDLNARPGGGKGVPSTTTGGGEVTTILDDNPPPPLPTPTPVKVLRISEQINSRALSLPKPVYPSLGVQIRLQGVVNVQVLTDESGKVVSAKAISGHPILIPDSVRAAMNARFSPTTLNGQAVKVSGIITYNFVLP
jgi:hypothetical protein